MLDSGILKHGALWGIHGTGVWGYSQTHMRLGAIHTNPDFGEYRCLEKTLLLLTLFNDGK